MLQTIIYTKNVVADLHQLCEGYDHIFLLTDEHTHTNCVPLLGDYYYHLKEISIPAGDRHKDLRSLTMVWNTLQEQMATRKSLLVNLGGGMVTDLGGFAAACFKRGIDFINVPTTLLAMVDAAVGGKTGINFNALKNEIGTFREAKAVLVGMDFLKTLSQADMFSGYAEMLKHALLSHEAMWQQHIQFDFSRLNYDLLQKMVKQSIETKQRIVQADPEERGIRKALNAGHTVGHALETWAMRHGKNQLHGYFVAWGLVAELYMSIDKGFSELALRQCMQFVKHHYERLSISCEDYEELYELMQHDKKNTNGVINFTLFEAIGHPLINCKVEKEVIFEALDFIREA